MTEPIVVALLFAALTCPAGAAGGSSIDGPIDRLIEQALPDGDREHGSREAFLDVLSSDLFLHEAVGPFDVFVYRVDGFSSERKADKTLRAVVEGLEPTLPVIERHFGGEAGLIAGKRLPIVLAHSDRAAGEEGFDQLVALLDWAEADDTGWKAEGNPIWTDELRNGVTVRTWEVQLFNLAHELARGQGDDFLEHGLGYYTLAHVSATVLRRGSWGMVPPWLAQGLIDELDIEAYGEAWVGGDWWKKSTPGWFRPGWSGFVPQGASPPPPVTGPPADLAVTVSRTGDSWQHRDYSDARHWEHLAADRKSEAPASFAFMAENESFLPRDRALARAVLHVMLHLAPPEGRDGLLALLDRVPTTPPSGMPDADPLPVVLNEVLGGVPAVDELEAMPMEDMLETIGRPAIAQRLRELGAADVLRLRDHREQAEWLYRMPEFDSRTRGEIWNLILEAEYYQQLHAWELLGRALDRGVDAMFGETRRYPRRSRDARDVAEAFWSAVSSDG